VELDNNSGWDDYPIISGDSIAIYNTSGDVEEQGDIVRIIWDDPSGGSSSELSTSEWP